MASRGNRKESKDQKKMDDHVTVEVGFINIIITLFINNNIIALLMVNRLNINCVILKQCTV